MKANQNKKVKKPDYGQDMPGVILIISILAIVFLSLAFWQYHQYTIIPDGQNSAMTVLFASFGILFIALAITGIWSSRFGKLILRDKVLNKLHFKGSETILDLGCGKGLLLIEAAKRVPEGKATGADIWEQILEYKYSARMVRDNAQIEGVSDRIEVLTADAQAMSFADKSFDIVMTSLMMHHVPDIQKALAEMVRVLKPGGTIVIADVNSLRYIPMLKSLGLNQVESHFATRLFLIPAYIIMGSKL